MAVYGLTQVTAPTLEPLSTADAKAHCRITIDVDDVLVGQMLTRARLVVEEMTGVQLLNSQWRLTMDSFPPYDMSMWLIRQPRPYLPQTRQFQGSGGGTIRLPRYPLVSVDSITYVDVNGVVQTLDPSLYLVGTASKPGRVAPSFGNVWPTTRWQLEAVNITFTAGYGATADLVPQDAIGAILVLVSHWYTNRDVAAGRMFEIPKGFDALMRLLWHGEI